VRRCPDVPSCNARKGNELPPPKERPEYRQVARAAVGLKSAIPARLYNWLFAGGFILLDDRRRDHVALCIGQGLLFPTDLEPQRKKRTSLRNSSVTVDGQSINNSRRFMSSIGGPSIPARAGAGQAGGLPHVQPAGGRVTPPRPSEQFYTDSAAPPGLRCSAHRGCVELRDL
jgi:hypothetical protein